MGLVDGVGWGWWIRVTPWAAACGPNDPSNDGTGCARETLVAYQEQAFHEEPCLESALATHITAAARDGLQVIHSAARASVQVKDRQL